MLSNKYFTIESCSPSTSRKIQLWLIGASVLVIGLIIYSPTEYLFKHFGYVDSNGCILLTLAGVRCPACGMGHSLSSIVKFDTAHWFYYNPSALFIYIITFFILAYIFILSLFNKSVKLTPKLLKLWYIPVTLLVIVWVLNVMYGHM